MSNFPDTVSKYMERCFQLARLGNSFVAPNPMVGAVLVHQDRIIGEGWHQKFGEAHAEVNCLNSVKKADQKYIPESTLYVSLEPCAHHGKTPPCADLIIRNKIPKVVISVPDPHILVNGRGIEKLLEAGVDVKAGVLNDEGRQLIKHFLCYHEKRRPYVTLKWSETADGFIGQKDKRIFISNELSNRYTHQLRADHEAILIGKNTLQTDDPELTVRLVPGKNPVRIILSAAGEIAASSKIAQNKEGYTILLNEMKSAVKNNTEWIKIADTKNIRLVLHALHELKIISVLVEGGTEILNSFIQSGCWDEAVIFKSDKFIEDGIKAPKLKGDLLYEIHLENDTVNIYKNPHDLSFA